MAKCEKLINACIAADCNNPVFTGVEENAWIFNKSEIEGFVYATDTNSNTIPNEITEIQMATGKNGYTISQLGKTPYTGTNVSLVEGNFGNTFTNTVNLVVPDNSVAASKDILDNLANGKFVVVLKNSYDGSDGISQFQVFGVKKGLTATAMDNDKYSEDTNGGWAITLTEEGSPCSAYFLRHETTPGTDDTETYLGTITSCI